MPVEKIPSWIERLLLPRLNSIEGELKAINTRIDSIEDQAGSFRNEMLSRFEATDNKIDSLRNEMLSKFEGLDYRFEAINTRLDSLENRIPVIEEITALKLRIAELEKRLAVA